MNLQKYENKAPYPNQDTPREERRRMREEYLANGDLLVEEFWKDFAKEEGISTAHPKFQLLRDIAWREGHSSGLHEVYHRAIQLVEFLRCVN